MLWPSRLFLRVRMKRKLLGDLVFKLCLGTAAILSGLALYHRTINMWSLKNLGDAFLVKDIGSRIIVLGTFFREKTEQNVEGKYAVVHFLGDSRESHSLFCFSQDPGQEDPIIRRALIQRIHQGKRAANDICSWAGHLAECEVTSSTSSHFQIGTVSDLAESSVVQVEPRAVDGGLHPLVVCFAPLYIYTDWEIALTGIETWIALGATKIIIPIQSASTTTYKILKAYEEQGIVVIRHWPKWPVLSDSNPNGLVLSRGIEESHVNCLFYIKPFADMAVFTDIDDMLLPINPQSVKLGGNIELLQSLFDEHPQAGSLLFEHRDTQLRLPSTSNVAHSLSDFNFNFLHDSKTKQNCEVWRMKTRVAVKAGRVDSVNMHETGIHRFGYVQTRIPCRQGHFYHLRHSHSNVADAASISLSPLVSILNGRWQTRLSSTFSSLLHSPLNRSSTESFADFDRCMSAINEEHWTMRVSRCLTPHVCFSRLQRRVECVAATANFSFARSGSAYLIFSHNSSLVDSLHNCEAPIPTFTRGNHFFAP